MKWCVDVDGVITANPYFWAWWIYELRKNNQKVIILTSRNPNRKEKTKVELANWGITYDEIYFMDSELPRGYDTQAKWKVDMVKILKPDIWVDNEFKSYERTLGVSTDVKGVTRIEI